MKRKILKELLTVMFVPILSCSIPVGCDLSGNGSKTGKEKPVADVDKTNKEKPFIYSEIKSMDEMDNIIEKMRADVDKAAKELQRQMDEWRSGRK